MNYLNNFGEDKFSLLLKRQQIPTSTVGIGTTKHGSTCSVSGCPLGICACIPPRCRGETKRLRTSLARCSTLVRGVPVLTGTGTTSTCTSYLSLCHRLRSCLIQLLPFFPLKGNEGQFFSVINKGNRSAVHFGQITLIQLISTLCLGS